MGEPMVHCCLVVLRDYARKCSELAWDCRGFCKGGSKNGSSLPVLPCGFVGLCRGRLLTGLGW